MFTVKTVSVTNRIISTEKMDLLKMIKEIMYFIENDVEKTSCLLNCNIFILGSYC